VKRWAIAALAAILPGCGPMMTPPPPKAAASDLPGATNSPIRDNTARLEGVDLWLYGTDPTAGADRKPTCWVHADAFTLEHDNAWSLESAKAVIYARDGDAPDIRIEARHGRFEESKMASLRNGVTAQIGDIWLKMEEVLWLNDERELRTDRPVSITARHMQLHAEALRLYPDKQEISMTRVTGTIELEGNQP